MPILFGGQDCLFKIFCIWENSHMTFFTIPHIMQCTLGSLPRPLQKQNTSSVNPVLPNKHLSLCSRSVWAPGAHTTPSLMGRTDGLGGGGKEQRWLVTAHSWCSRISPACRLVPPPLSTTVVSIHVDSVRGYTELISWQKLVIIAGCGNTSLYLILKGND